ncbi:RNA polymerase sigma factor [Sphingomonas sp. PAMC 26617]|uniref:RNA polymerase sigma factor n=1 Tax=Sphingomonas sp. PAMC 26617 TaxID=1112216 RepID=UPI0002886070|nr:sigma factor-like helix-turn-helix DNA-binding protein [Sphingomonas sp. PAMC 26617]
MSENRKELEARNRRASKRLIESASREQDGPVDPAQLAAIERALRALPKMTREVFLAHRLDGLDYIEIGKAAGLSPQQVERHMVKALCQLSRFMDGDERTPWQRRWNSFVSRWR